MNTVELVGRMLLALVVVLGVMWALAKWAHRSGGPNTDRVLNVLARQQVSKTSSITVLQVLDQALVLGVTEHGIRLLTEVDLAQVQSVLTTPDHPPARRLRLSGRSTADKTAAATDPAFDTAGLAYAGTAPMAATEPTEIGYAATPVRRGVDGSVFSPAVWRQLLDTLRNLTTRR